MTDVEVMCEEGGLRERELGGFNPEDCVVYRPKKKTKVDSVPEKEINHDDNTENADGKEAEPVTISLSDRIIYEEKNDLEEAGRESSVLNDSAETSVRLTRDYLPGWDFVEHIAEGRRCVVERVRNDSGLEAAFKSPRNLSHTEISELKKEAKIIMQLAKNGSEHTPKFAFVATGDEKPGVYTEFVPYSVEELFDGKINGKLDVEGKMKLFGEMLNPIRDLHKGGHVLLDIKLENYRFDKDGESVKPVFVDFESKRASGIRQVSQSVAQSISLQNEDITPAVKTLVYMAPELRDGNVEKLKGREHLCDIYSAGVSLYYLLMEELPWISPEQLTDDKRVVESLGEEKAGRLNDFLMKRVLANDAAKRPQSVEEFVSEMNEITGYKEENPLEGLRNETGLSGIERQELEEYRRNEKSKERAIFAKLRVSETPKVKRQRVYATAFDILKSKDFGCSSGLWFNVFSIGYSLHEGTKKEVIREDGFSILRPVEKKKGLIFDREQNAVIGKIGIDRDGEFLVNVNAQDVELGKKIAAEISEATGEEIRVEIDKLNPEIVKRRYTFALKKQMKAERRLGESSGLELLSEIGTTTGKVMSYAGALSVITNSPELLESKLVEKSVDIQEDNSDTKIEVYKLFEGRAIETMPKLLGEGRYPLSIAEYMRMAIDNSWNNLRIVSPLTTSDLIAYDSSERSTDVKFILTVDKDGRITPDGRKTLELIYPGIELESTSSHSYSANIEGMYDSLKGIEVSREKLGIVERNLLDEEILNSKVWRILARHPDEVPPEFAEDENLLKEYARLVKVRSGRYKNMQIYLFKNRKMATLGMLQIDGPRQGYGSSSLNMMGITSGAYLVGKLVTR
ncbi:hypothetical protein HY450_02085 [Candidatus Pacearchaeota archaeon]|nr:hypothetical protein [Candidatus Pacearchaeota archaeon]